MTYTEKHFDLESCEQELHQDFIQNIAPSVVAQYSISDEIALDEAFNNWTDSLCKGGELCEYAYNNIAGIDWNDCDVMRSLEQAVLDN